MSLEPEDHQPPVPRHFAPFQRVVFTQAHWSVLSEYGRVRIPQLRIANRGTVVEMLNPITVRVRWDKGETTDHFSDNLEVIL